MMGNHATVTDDKSMPHRYGVAVSKFLARSAATCVHVSGSLMGTWIYHWNKDFISTDALFGASIVALGLAVTVGLASVAVWVLSPEAEGNKP